MKHIMTYKHLNEAAGNLRFDVAQTLITMIEGDDVDFEPLEPVVKAMPQKEFDALQKALKLEGFLNEDIVTDRAMAPRWQTTKDLITKYPNGYWLLDSILTTSTLEKVEPIIKKMIEGDDLKEGEAEEVLSTLDMLYKREQRK